MKKSIAIVLTLCLLLSLGACATKKVVEVDPAVLHGNVSGNTYTNDFLKLQCTLPDGWSFYDEAQIAELNQMTQQVMEGSEIAEAIEKSGQYMDMFFSSADGRCNANLNFQLNDHKADLFSDEKLFEAMESTVTKQLSDAGMTVNSYNVETLNFCGEEKACIRLEQTVNGLDLTQYILYFRNETNYYGALTLSCMGDTDVQTLLDCFSKLP